MNYYIYNWEKEHYARIDTGAIMGTRNFRQALSMRDQYQKTYNPEQYTIVTVDINLPDPVLNPVPKRK